MTVLSHATGVRPSTRVGSLRRPVRVIQLSCLVADVAVLVLAVVSAWRMRLAFGLWAAPVDPSQHLASVAGPWIVLGWLVLLAGQRAYSARVFGAGPDEFRAVVLASFLTSGAVAMVCYLIKFDLSRGFMVLTFVIGTTLLLGERYVIRKAVHRLRAAGRMTHRVVAVGGPAAVRELVHVLHRERHVGYEIVGACVPSGLDGGFEDIGLPVLGDVSRTLQACRELGADTVLVCDGAYSSSGDLRAIAWDLQGSSIELVVVPSLTDVAGPRIHMRPVAGLPLLHLAEPQVDEAGGLPKRVFDVVGSAIGIVALLPVMLFVALAIKLDDGGPIWFRQRRVGRGGGEFGMLKFRTMVAGADEYIGAMSELNESDGPLFKIKADPRVTRVGRILRRHSLDELPQLLNVLTGRMSLVGPRPPLHQEVDAYESGMRRRLLVRPGMTGLWQVSGRSTLSWDEAVRLDLYYVENWSMTADLLIMAKTVRAVLGGSGAY